MSHCEIDIKKSRYRAETTGLPIDKYKYAGDSNGKHYWRTSVALAWGRA